jgi:trehalose 6-phosphate phosphatase
MTGGADTADGAVSSEDLWLPWRSNPGAAVIVTDFDGTLAPIVDDPAAAVALPGTSDVLSALAERCAAVAVVSGRPVAYLLERLGDAPAVQLVGLYGLERSRNGAVTTLPEAEQWRTAVDKATEAAQAGVPTGVGVEPKGLALTLHWRRAPEQATWVQRFAERLATDTDLAWHGGRQSVELRPPVAADKGTVVTNLCQGASAACYFGDDLGDLPAFAALAAARHRGIRTVSVGVISEEAPPGLAEAVDVAVDGPPAVLALLRSLL